MRSCRIGGDIGGTFTDLVAISADGTVTTPKIISSPRDYGEGIMASPRTLLAGPADKASDVLHATMVGSNAVPEAKGAPTAPITTRGFRDILEIRFGEKGGSRHAQAYMAMPSVPGTRLAMVEPEIVLARWKHSSMVQRNPAAPASSASLVRVGAKTK